MNTKNNSNEKMNKKTPRLQLVGAFLSDDTFLTRVKQNPFNNKR